MIRDFKKSAETHKRPSKLVAAQLEVQENSSTRVYEIYLKQNPSKLSQIIRNFLKDE
jgi:hypothetical protein